MAKITTYTYTHNGIMLNFNICYSTRLQQFYTNVSETLVSSTTTTRLNSSTLAGIKTAITNFCDKLFEFEETITAVICIKVKKQYPPIEYITRRVTDIDPCIDKDSHKIGFILDWFIMEKIVNGKGVFYRRNGEIHREGLIDGLIIPWSSDTVERLGHLQKRIYNSIQRYILLGEMDTNEFVEKLHNGDLYHQVDPKL